MRTFLGLILALLGVGLVGLGIYNAAMELGALYEHVQADPLAEPDIAEEDRPGRMLGHLALAGVGLAPLIAGTVLLKLPRRRRPRAEA